MRPLTSNEIYGNWATLLLPVERDESINYEKLSRQIDQLISMKVNGIYSNGTAGEFYNQTEEEFDEISMLLSEKCNKAAMPFQIGCNHMSPKLSLERLKRIVRLAPGAIQVILPDWFPPTMPEIISYLRVMTEAANGIGLVLYNPPHAKKKLSPQDFYEIKKAGIALVGCKLAAGDEKWYAEMKELVPDLSLFTPGNRLATGIGLGANGSYSNVACLHPKVAQQWYETMLTDREKALELEKRIQSFITNHIYPFIKEKGYSDPAVDKLLACITGWADLTPRLLWPYRWISEDELSKVRIQCREIIPEFFSDTKIGSSASL
jgi:4-hydroxy-tetrahydrodipicolinate synthase